VFDSGNGGSLKRGGNKSGSNHQANLRINGGNSSNFPSKHISIGRTKLVEEVECEKLSKELLEYLPSSDSIKKHASLFVVPTEGKATADYMEGLDLDLDDVQLHSSSLTKTNISPSMLKKRIEVLQHEDKRLTNGVSKPTTNQEYQNNEDTETKSKMFGEANSKNANILLKKREGLTSLISKKLEVLRAEQLSLKGEKKLNEELGRQVTVKVMQSAAPNECEKYKLLVEETDKITSLLLGLSGRLARTENSLQVAIMLSPQGETQEKEQLFTKRDKLVEQLTEAKKLKQNIDKRSSIVSRILQKYLSEEQLSIYQTFIKTKTKLIIETRITNDKIALSEEQLNALKE
jgi:protein Shroom